MLGYFDHNQIFVDLEISGSFPESKKVVKAQIDTGYDGELTLPFSLAFPLGLILTGANTYTIADGSSMTNFSCIGKIKIAGKQESVFVDIIPNGSVLIGLPLLEKLGNNFQVNFSKREIKFT